jgi:phosphatidylinositol alpha 1,6-mannosyltransferase
MYVFGRDGGAVRVAVVAETFHPAVNGVSGSVSRVIEYLNRTGHETLVVAPGPGDDSHLGVRVVRTPSFRPPVYRSVQLGWPSTPLAPILQGFGADVVHLASPALLGLAGARAARSWACPRWRCSRPTWPGSPSVTTFRSARTCGGTFGACTSSAP